MRIISSSRWIGRLGLLAALSLSCTPPAQAARLSADAAPAPSVVGYWMGERTADSSSEEPTDPAAYYRPADRSALTPEVWRVLQQRRVPLYLHVRYGRDFGPLAPGARSDEVALVRKANALGVPVIAWIVVPYEDGYWAYQGNAPAVFAAVKAWVAWKKANHLQFASVALDQEFSWQNLKTYVAAVTSRDPAKLSAWMRGNIDPSAQCRAFHAYRDLISWAHREGVRVDAAEAPMVVDDLTDGDLALQNALQIAGSSPGYDRMYLMAYRSAVAAAGIDPGPAYAASYYTAMQQHFGAAGQVSLGIPGQGPYATLAPLVDDVRMLVGLGAKQIPIYSLEDMVARFGPEGVRTLAEAAQRPMQSVELAQFAKPTPASERVLATSQAHDATASELTRAVTRDQGRPQSANRWPDGCGDLSADRLVNAPE